ncbi:NYN domain-containing protein [Burkholderia sp. MSMB1498]|uniref:NYN domain-containing protein n=1 Tax=Burkholderia sp. MSMB1498 TaxID=1637842 RepID=UPI00075E4265|nr:hypothetical protein [Burkholderia sp. MSMB1498]KVK77162.1 hypothetical protein WS91_01830 [Burkholderia sp. MSMB1498]
MEYNPYTVRYAALEASLSAAKDELSKYMDQLERHSKFDVDKAFAAHIDAVRESEALKLDLEKISNSIAEQGEWVTRLYREKRPGLDPRSWFSGERLARKREFTEQDRIFNQLRGERDELRERIDAADARISSLRSDLERHRCFDVLEAEAAIKALNTHVLQLTFDRARLQPMKIEVDRQLLALLGVLANLKLRKSELLGEIADAWALDRRLNAAVDDHERETVREACRMSFLDARPDLAASRKQAKLAATDRNIGKLEARLKLIAHRANRSITSIVIDGNNLCYQYQAFIGIEALKALVRELSRNYSVIVVFDASIRRLLGAGDQEISASFSDTAKVHVVAPRQQADETILGSASASNVYVISNDQFVEFPDKLAVREHRIIRHAIVNNRVMVNDLNVEADFALAGQSKEGHRRPHVRRFSRHRDIGLGRDSIGI